MKKFRKIMAVLVAAIMIVATWAPAMVRAAESHTLTYNLNGGETATLSPVTSDTAITVNNGVDDSSHALQHANENGIPVKFIGWTETPYGIQAANSNPVHTVYPTEIASITLSADKELFALWGYDYNNNGTADIAETGTAYQISFDGNGGTGVPDSYYIKHAPVVFRGVYPTKADRIFVGWSKTQNVSDAGAGSNPVQNTDFFLNGDSDSAATSATTYYALWSPDSNNDGIADCFESSVTIEYSVGDKKLNANGIVRDLTTSASKASESKLQNTTFKPTAPSNPTGTFYDEVKDETVKVAFIGWSTDPNATKQLYYRGDAIPAVIDEYTVPRNATGTITLYTVWGVDKENPEGTADIITDAAGGNVDTVEIVAHNTTGTAGQEDHEAYFIFDVTRTSAQSSWKQVDSNIDSTLEDGFAYTIKTDNPWFEKLWTAGTGMATPGQDFVILEKTTDPDTYNVKWNSGTNADPDGAKAFAAFLMTNKPTGLVSPYVQSFKTGEKLYTKPGYYLITSTLGTNLILATSSLEVKDKNKYVSDEKARVESNVSVGDKVTYFIQVYVPQGISPTTPIIVHDTLDNELAFDENTLKFKTSSTKIDDLTAENLNTYSALNNNYTLNTSPTDGCTFEVKIDTAQFATANDTWVIFGYQAELLSSAEAGKQYVNKEYSQYSNYKTAPNTVTVETFAFDFKKYDSVDASATPAKLDGAVFELYDSSGDLIYFVTNTYYKDSDYITPVTTRTTEFKGASGTATVADSNIGNNNKTTYLVAGELKVNGLGEGTYYLVEKYAPKGYNKLTKRIEITINHDGTQTVKNEGEVDTANYMLNNETPKQFNVPNTTSKEMPSTGGMGTTVLYIVGGMLVILAGAYLFFSRKRTA